MIRWMRACNGKCSKMKEPARICRSGLPLSPAREKDDWRGVGSVMNHENAHDGVLLFAFTCGYITLPMSFFLDGEPGKVKVPACVYLIDHPRGLVLFDTGFSTRFTDMAEGRKYRRPVAGSGGRSITHRLDHQLSSPPRPCRRQCANPQCNRDRPTGRMGFRHGGAKMAPITRSISIPASRLNGCQASMTFLAMGR